MHRQRHLARSAAVLIGTALLVPVGAAPGRTATTETTPTTHHRYAQSEIVLGGAWVVEFGTPIRGNRHQVRLRTDNGVVSGFIRSWYCPTGASVSPRWASSRCTHRQTIWLKNLDGHRVGRVSSTGRSATQSDYFMGVSGSRSWPFDADLTLFATSEPTDDGDGTFYSWWRDARPQGTFAGKQILSGTTRYGQIGGYGPA
ncbi:hypothetical protein AWH69_09195 [Janibacter melonis]|uniref:Uncharacterized protein n=1 Tax=Janibacter melonis TaxID=262209 RepID=A0A176QAF1_9MICO|nr:hypothetical protein [Janibacter melonis]OAB86634.1 hypothetical protein AWH69_09195 [Janibacter melonis]